MSRKRGRGGIIESLEVPRSFWAPSTSSSGRSSFNSECARLPFDLSTDMKQVCIGSEFQATDLPECRPFTKENAKIKEPALLEWSRRHCPLKEHEIKNYVEFAKGFYVDQDKALTALLHCNYKLPSAFTLLPHLKSREDEQPLTLDEKAVYERTLLKENRLSSIKDYYQKDKIDQLNQYFYNEMNFEKGNFVSAFILPDTGDGSNGDAPDKDKDKGKDKNKCEAKEKDDAEDDAEDEDENEEEEDEEDKKKDSESIINYLMDRTMRLDADDPQSIKRDDYVIDQPLAASFMRWIVHPDNQPEANYLNVDQHEAMTVLRRRRANLRELNQTQTQDINRRMTALCSTNGYFMQYYSSQNMEAERSKMEEAGPNNPGWKINEVMILIEWIRRHMNSAGEFDLRALADFLGSKTREDCARFFSRNRKALCRLVRDKSSKSRVQKLYQWFTDGWKLNEDDDVFFEIIGDDVGQAGVATEMDAEENDEEEVSEEKESEEEVNEEENKAIEDEAKENEVEVEEEIVEEEIVGEVLEEEVENKTEVQKEKEMEEDENEQNDEKEEVEEATYLNPLEQFAEFALKSSMCCLHRSSEERHGHEQGAENVTFTSSTRIDHPPELVAAQNNRQSFTGFESGNEHIETSHRVEEIDSYYDDEDDLASSKELVIDESVQDSDSDKSDNRGTSEPEDKKSQETASAATAQVKDATEALPRCGIEQYFDPISDGELESPEGSQHAKDSLGAQVLGATEVVVPPPTAAPPTNPQQTSFKMCVTAPPPPSSPVLQRHPQVQQTAHRTSQPKPQITPPKPPEPEFDPKTAYLLRPELLKSLPKIPRLNQPKTQQSLHASAMQSEPPTPPLPLPTKTAGQQSKVNIVQKNVPQPPQSVPPPTLPTSNLPLNSLLKLGTLKFVLPPTTTTGERVLLVKQATTMTQAKSANILTTSSLTQSTASPQKRPTTITTVRPKPPTTTITVKTISPPSKVPATVPIPLVPARPTTTSKVLTTQTPPRPTVQKTFTTTQPPPPTTSKMVTPKTSSRPTLPVALPTVQPPPPATTSKLVTTQTLLRPTAPMTFTTVPPPPPATTSNLFINQTPFRPTAPRTFATIQPPPPPTTSNMFITQTPSLPTVPVTFSATQPPPPKTSKMFAVQTPSRPTVPATFTTSLLPPPTTSKMYAIQTSLRPSIPIAFTSTQPQPPATTSMLITNPFQPTTAPVALTDLTQPPPITTSMLFTTPTRPTPPPLRHTTVSFPIVANPSPATGTATTMSKKIFIQSLPPGFQMQPGMYQVTLPAPEVSPLISPVTSAGGSSHTQQQQPPQPQTISILTKKSSPSGNLVALSTVPIVLRPPPPPLPPPPPKYSGLLSSFAKEKRDAQMRQNRKNLLGLPNTPSAQVGQQPVHSYGKQTPKNVQQSSSSKPLTSSPAPLAAQKLVTTMPTTATTTGATSLQASSAIPITPTSSFVTSTAPVASAAAAAASVPPKKLTPPPPPPVTPATKDLKTSANPVTSEHKTTVIEKKAPTSRKRKGKEEQSDKEKKRRKSGKDGEQKGRLLKESKAAVSIFAPPTSASSASTAVAAAAAITSTPSQKQRKTSPTAAVAEKPPIHWYSLDKLSGDLKLQADQLEPRTPAAASSSSTSGLLQSSASVTKQAAATEKASPSKQQEQEEEEQQKGTSRKSIITASTYKSLGLERLKSALGTSGPGSKSRTQLLEETKAMVAELGKDLDQKVRQIWAKSAYDNRHFKPAFKRKRRAKNRDCSPVKEFPPGSK